MSREPSVATRRKRERERDGARSPPGSGEGATLSQSRAHIARHEPRTAGCARGRHVPFSVSTAGCGPGRERDREISNQCLSIPRVLRSQQLPKHQAPDSADEPARSAEIVPQPGIPSRPAVRAQDAHGGGSPVTPEVLRSSMGGPTRTPRQDTVHKVAMLLAARWANAPVNAAAERRPRVVRRTMLGFSMAVSSGWRVTGTGCPFSDNLLASRSSVRPAGP